MSAFAPRLRLLFVACCFFLSGATGLVYEIVWSRRLELTFGNTSYSIGVVLAAYMAGLGLGAWLMGRYADRPGSAATRYAVLEAGIGVWGLLAPWALELVEVLYVAAGGAGGLLTRAVLGFVAILPATILMGGTLPVLARAFTHERGETQRAVGLLYGINTVGAVCGVLVAGFGLKEWLGIDAASRWTGVVNLALAVVVLLLRRPLALRVRPAAEGGADEAPPDSEAARKQRGQLAVALTFGVGAVALSLEIAWTRALSLAVGTSGHSFTIMLAATLLGIGLGSLLVARRQPDERAPLRHVALAMLLLGVANVGFLLSFDRLPSLFYVIAQPRVLHYEQLLALTFGLCALLLLPATLAMGLAFPLSVQLGTPAGATSGESVGRLYLANTSGAILGSLAGGFLLLPLLGSDGVIRFGVALIGLGVVGLARLARSAGGWSKRRCIGFAVCGTVLTLSVLPSFVPLWDTRRLDLDPLRYNAKGVPRDPGTYQRLFIRGGSVQLYAREGRNAFVTIRAVSDGVSMTLGGKADASNMEDMPTQLLCGALPFVARPDAKRVLMVGAGSGVSARVAAEFPSVERMDLVEIEEAIVDAARTWFEFENHKVFDRDNVRMVYEDARTHLLVSDDRYDVIISQPTNPFVSGVANLFTQEHYANVQRRLNPGGIHLQWVQAYDADDWMLRAMLRTTLESFPHVDLWWSTPGDMLLLGSDQPIVYEREAMQRLAQLNPGLKADLRKHLLCRDPDELFARFYLHKDELVPLVASGTLLSDRRPLLEGRAARARYLRSGGLVLLGELNRARMRRGTLWPRSLAGRGEADDFLRAAAVRMGWARSGDALNVLGGVRGAEAVWLRIREGRFPPEGAALLEQALEAYPDDPDLLLGLARIAQRRGDGAARNRWLSRIDALGGLLEGHYRFLRAARALEAGDAAALVAEVEAALPLIGFTPDESTLRGEALWLLVQLDDPLTVGLLERLYRDRPFDAQAGSALADLHLKAGRHQLGLEVLEQLFENGEDYNPELRRRYLGALRALGRPELIDEARRYLEDYPSQATDPAMHDTVRLLREDDG